MAASIRINRSACDTNYLQSVFQGKEPKPETLTSKGTNYLQGHCRCSAKCVKKKLLRFFPFIGILVNYRWKEDIVFDIMAGITVGVIHIPQGMGFSLLTSLPPVYGLYSSFFPVLIYFFFGTSRHISIGTMALVSLMIGAVVDRESVDFTPSGGANGNSSIHNSSFNESNNIIINQGTAELDLYKAGVATSVSLLVGIVQVIMSLLRMDAITTLMPMSVINGFSTGAGFHIATSQVKHIFGLNINRVDGMFKLPLTYVEVAKHITETNIAALIVSVVCIIFLVFFKEFINEKYKDKLKIPIPAELIVVTIGIIVSHFAKLNENYHVRIIKYIPAGFPTPTVPSLHNATNYIGDVVMAAIISFAVSISMAKIFAERNDYEIDDNQELLAYGMCNAISAFFWCFAGAVAPPRSFAHESAGGKSQLAGLVSCILLMLVLLVMGPLFEPLPTSVLAPVIIVSLFPLFKAFATLPDLWRTNRYDCLSWIVTWAAVTMLDFGIGLVIGIAFALLMASMQALFVEGHSMGALADTGIFVPKENFQSTSDIPGVIIFKYEASLFYINVESFKSKMFSKTVNPRKLLKKQQKEEKKQAKEKKKPKESQSMDHLTRELSNSEPVVCDVDVDQSLSVHTIILDCSCMSYVDTMGLKVLQKLIKDYEAVGVNLRLACCPVTLQASLNKAAGKDVGLPLYPTIMDAIAPFVNSNNVFCISNGKDTDASEIEEFTRL